MVIKSTDEGEVYQHTITLDERFSPPNTLSTFADLAFLFAADGSKHISRMEQVEAAMMFSYLSGKGWRVLDIGTRHGGSALICAVAMPGGKVLSLDIQPDIPFPLQRFLSHSTVSDRIEFRKRTSRTPLDEGLFDGVIFDGDHTSYGVSRDVLAHWSNISPYGFAIFHDVNLNELRPGAGYPKQQAQNRFQAAITPIVAMLLEKGIARFGQGVGDLVILEKQTPLTGSALKLLQHIKPHNST